MKLLSTLEKIIVTEMMAQIAGMIRDLLLTIMKFDINVSRVILKELIPMLENLLNSLEYVFLDNS